ncbi:PPC domain-containing protein [Kamptonema sp. UHCC 0994]|uniref:PPC domain-containing protein n=1 Tax=Kamptonema sp. UHCC 0994 TaxID=3031329 RepID=UPI0023BAA805|nr:PPC domain-containing protein [Kamptonema sp. UHCC 0994]MDF0556635.1 PPC domain-containing protein [Kamptonema sp. UHCC 0994]
MLDLRSLFDNAFYLENNPDVGLAIANGKVSSGFDHFNRFGKFEDRDPNILFDTSYYLETNTDVAAAVEEGKITAADHFIRFGQFERRNPNPLFDTAFYGSNNLDVTAAVQRNQLTLAEHYLKLGQFENRQPSLLFDPDYYLQKYPLVAAAVNNGVVRSAFEHYLRFGLEETLVSVPPTQSEDLTSARSLGVLDGIQGVSDFVGDTEPVDIYSFLLNSPSNFSLTLDGLSADADVELLQDINRDGIVGINGLVGSSTNFGTASEQIISPRPLPAGLYFVRVSQFQGDTNYNLTLSSALS